MQGSPPVAIRLQLGSRRREERRVVQRCWRHQRAAGAAAAAANALHLCEKPRICSFDLLQALESLAPLFASHGPAGPLHRKPCLECPRQCCRRGVGVGGRAKPPIRRHGGRRARAVAARLRHARAARDRRIEKSAIVDRNGAPAPLRGGESLQMACSEGFSNSRTANSRVSFGVLAKDCYKYNSKLRNRFRSLMREKKRAVFDSSPGSSSLRPGFASGPWFFSRPSQRRLGAALRERRGRRAPRERTQRLQGSQEWQDRT